MRERLSALIAHNVGGGLFINGTARREKRRWWAFSSQNVAAKRILQNVARTVAR
jgi:hypothetical protein